MVSGFNPHKPSTTETSTEVKRSIFGHLDAVTNQKGGKVAKFMSQVLADPASGKKVFLD